MGKKKEYLKPMCISLVLMALQQLSGINYVLSYSQEIFKSSGSSIDPCVSSMLTGAIQVAGTGFTTVIIEKLGRKILLIISDAFICISMIGVAVFFKLKESCGDECQTGDATVFVSKTTVDGIGFLPLVSLLIFVTAFSIGFGPISWVLNVEMMPPEARGIAASICTSFNWLSPSPSPTWSHPSGKPSTLPRATSYLPELPSPAPFLLCLSSQKLKGRLKTS